VKPLMVRTEKELRNHCARMLADCGGEGTLWLLSGDLDLFRDLNRVFGRAVMDMVLHCGQGALLAALREFEGSHDLDATKTLFVGDEIFFLFPPSSLKEEEVRALARRLREVLYGETAMSYLAMAVRNPSTASYPLENWCPPHLQAMLQEKQILIEGNTRSCGGVLTAGKINGAGESRTQAARRIVRNINSLCSSGQPFNITFRWLRNPVTGSFEHFNDGYIPPLSISFGIAGSQAMNAGADPMEVVNDLFQRAEESLRKSKKTADPGGQFLVPPVSALSRTYDPGRAGVPIMSESELRLCVHELSKCGEKGVMVRIEFRYAIGHDPARAGNGPSRKCSAIGLKGVNRELGHRFGDLFIRLLESAVYHSVSRWCHSRRVPRRKVLISRFIDMFTLYFTDLRLNERSLVRILKRIYHQFNDSLHGASLSEMRAAVVFNDEKIDGSLLFRRAELTVEAIDSGALLDRGEPLAIKCYRHGIEREGMERIEAAAYDAALRLMTLQSLQP